LKVFRGDKHQVGCITSKSGLNFLLHVNAEMATLDKAILIGFVIAMVKCDLLIFSFDLYKGCRQEAHIPNGENRLSARSCSRENRLFPKFVTEAETMGSKPSDVQEERRGQGRSGL